MPESLSLLRLTAQRIQTTRVSPNACSDLRHDIRPHVAGGNVSCAADRHWPSQPPDGVTRIRSCCGSFGADIISAACDPAPAGACILFANACGKNETELKVVWNILEQGGIQKKGRPRKEDEDDIEEAPEGAADGKGNEYRLLAWQERAAADGLGASNSKTQFLPFLL